MLPKIVAQGFNLYFNLAWVPQIFQLQIMSEYSRTSACVNIETVEFFSEEPLRQCSCIQADCYSTLENPFEITSQPKIEEPIRKMQRSPSTDVFPSPKIFYGRFWRTTAKMAMARYKEELRMNLLETAKAKLSQMESKSTSEDQMDESD